MASLGLLSCLTPFMPTTGGLYALAFFVGLVGGALDTGGNVFCLAIWRNREVVLIWGWKERANWELVVR